MKSAFLIAVNLAAAGSTSVGIIEEAISTNQHVQSSIVRVFLLILTLFGANIY
jgi:hypothetical protein